MGSGWVAAVLTGGASTRMGRDKAAIEVDGTAMADRVAAALRAAGALEVARIGGATGDVPDDDPGEGPLGGVLTALRWSDEQVLVVAPCDLVSPSPGTFTALVAELVASPGALAAVPDRDRPLPVALRATAEAPLRAAFVAGERSVRRALAGLDGAVVEVDGTGLDDADTPDRLPPGAR